ncbi:MAG: hypothetical protein RBU29_07825, partial [bacterium]|nr:hypothetical protein [bacterium]
KKTKVDLFFFYPRNAAFEFKKNADLVTGALVSAIQGLGAGAEAMAVGYASVPVVAMGFSGSQTIALLERSSLGWDAPTVLAAKAPVWDVRFLDLEQDGSDELLALCGMEKQSLLIYKKTTRLARLEWMLDRQIDLKLTGYRHFHAGQWNKESGLDLFLWNEGAGHFVSSLLGTPRLQPVTLPAAIQTHAVDLNGDALLDLLVLAENSNTLTWLRNDGSLFTPVEIMSEIQNIQEFITGYFTQTSQLEVFLYSQDKSAFPFVIVSGFDTGKIQTVVKDQFPLSTSNAHSVHENVLILKSQDWASGEPYVFRSFHIPDWTTGIASIAPDLSHLLIRRETFGEKGLTPASEMAIPLAGLGGDMAQYLVQWNQMETDFSHTSLHPPRVYSPLPLDVAPPNGEYQRAIAVEPFTEETADVFFRIGASGWQPYKEPIVVFDKTTISFYTQSQVQQQTVYSPVITRTYHFTGGPTQDSDGDGIPDQLEQGFQLPVLSSSFDYDGDSWNDLDELIRGSNPLDQSSVPADGDSFKTQLITKMTKFGDGWSDFDENARQTDASDAQSYPVAPSFDVAEYQLTLQLGDSLHTLPSPFTLSENSVLSVYQLTGDRVQRMEYGNEPWHFRLPGHQPFILRARERTNPSLVLLDYSSTHIPYWNPTQEYDGKITPAQWLTILQQKIKQEYYIKRTQTIGLETTATVLAFQYWLTRALDKEQAIQWSGRVPFPTPKQITQLQQEFDLDAVYHHFQKAIPSTAWLAVVQSVFGWAQNHPYLEGVDIVLQHLLLRQPIPKEWLPPDLTTDRVDQIIQALDTLCAKVPSRSIDAIGTLAWQGQQVLFSQTNGTVYALKAEGWNFTPEATVQLKGRILPKNQNSALPQIQVESLTLIDEANPWGWRDRDGDGLPDDWEDYYFGYRGASPEDDSDGDGRTNKQEYEERTHPFDPRLTPTQPTPTPIPVVTPTPTVLPSDPLEPTRRFAFNQDTLDGEGFMPMPGGFQGRSPGNAYIGENPDSTLASDFRQGAFLQCEPGEVILLMTQPIVVGKNPVFVRVSAKASNAGGQFAIAVLDGDYNGSIASWIPANSHYLQDKMHQITFLYEPVKSDTISVVVQLFTPEDANARVEVYIDDVEIIPFVPGIPIAGGSLGITPLSTRLDGRFQRITTGRLPMPAAVYTFDQKTLAEAQCMEFPGGFDSYPGGESALGEIPKTANEEISNGRGLIFTCDPGENQLILGFPPIEVGPYPVLIKCYVQTSSPEGQFAIAALDGTFNGSIATLIPNDSATLTGQYQQACLLYQPTDSTTVAPALQLFVPSTATGSVTAYVDNLQVIPIRPTDQLEASFVSRTILDRKSMP